MSSRQANPARAARTGTPPPGNEQMLALGKLSFLASFCPLHRTYPGHALASVFIPAVNNSCVRFFENEDGATAAALIWARLDEDVSRRMLFDGVPPTSAEWAAGDTLWFIDLLAPFGHGRTVAREIARHPPDVPFYFARLDRRGQVKKVVEGDRNRGRRGLVRAHFTDEVA
jgi:cytolysin-activating lysine-acyltransferase